MKDLQPQQSLYKERRHVSIPFRVRPLKYYGTDYPAFICIFVIICRLFRFSFVRFWVLCMWVVYLKNFFFFWRISQWNNSRTTNSQNLGCERISTRPASKIGHFPGNCSKKCLTPAFKLPISPGEVWHPQGKRIETLVDEKHWTRC